MLRHLLAASLILPLFACEDAVVQSELGCEGDAGTTLGAAGGSIASPDGRVTLSVPASALGDDVQLSLWLVERTGDVVADPVVEFCPVGQALAQPALLTLIIDPADLGDTPIGDTAAASWTGSAWSVLTEHSRSTLEDGRIARVVRVSRLDRVAAAVPHVPVPACTETDACVRDRDCQAPAAACDGTTRLTHEARCTTACACEVVTRRVDCATNDQTCIDGACVEDLCDPNPCVHGTCSQSSTGYACACTGLFAGEDCDECPPQHSGYPFCVPDRDDDGVTDADDDCPDGVAQWVSNPSTDHDRDGCQDFTEDLDDDDDGVPDVSDDCRKGTTGWLSDAVSDVDADGCASADEDTDDDSDGVDDELDLADEDPSQCADADGDGCDDCSRGVDGLGPAADAKPDDDGVDSDGDGLCDIGDACFGDNAMGNPDADALCSDEDPCPVHNPDDSDGDTALDCVETCDNDPAKSAPGQCGCGNPDTDTDGDGTADCLDECDADAGKVLPLVCGCGVPDTDSDADGVKDCRDLCVNDAGKVEPLVCGCGVPDTDTDGDGTLDCLEACPTDPMKLAPGQCGCNVTEVDTDGDAKCDQVDPCPVDNPDNADGDEFCDSVDYCIDVDGDGFGTGRRANAECMAATIDVADGDPSRCIDSDGDRCDDCSSLTWDPYDDGTDLDADGACDLGDPCPLDNPDDSDRDGVCDTDDVCLGDDATGDLDADGLCDGSDPCFGDNLADTDNDGVCDSDDECVGDDATGDSDGDDICDDVDQCVDDDLDGICNGEDVCPSDNPNDPDNDGVCSSDDPCPLLANASADRFNGACGRDRDGDGWIAQGDGGNDCDDSTADATAQGACSFSCARSDVPGCMINVPASTGWMGCAPGDAACDDDESPLHKVTLTRPFWLHKHEVTTAAFETCVNGGGCTSAPDSGVACNWPQRASRGDHPINCVDWAQASQFCAQVGGQLPSEAQWERAARGLTTQTYPWGQGAATCSLAVMDDGAPGCGDNGTRSVGSVAAGISPTGALDLAGNVMEWVGDRYGSDYYCDTTPDTVAPYASCGSRPAIVDYDSDGDGVDDSWADPEGPATGALRVARGGAWSSNASALRVPNRSDQDPASRLSFIGFRCAMNAVDRDRDGYASVADGGDDCDDEDPAFSPGASDSVGDGVDQNCDAVDGDDGDGDGHASVASGGSDCDDTAPTIYVGASEIDDGVDQDCDGDRLEDATFDLDGDGFTPGYGSATRAAPDCDDTASHTFPGAAPTDSATACMRDADGDDFGDATAPGSVTRGSDCNDSLATTFPGAAANESPSLCMADADGDDWGDSTPPLGATAGDDCDDDSASTFPGAAPNNSTTACMKDIDGDNWGDANAAAGITDGTDCNDAVATTKPGATELDDGVDQDCDGDRFEIALFDADLDGFTAGYGSTTLAVADCDDASVVTYPGAAPLETNPNGCMRDADGDDYGDSTPQTGVLIGTDCDDDRAVVNPGATESCDALDNDCSGAPLANEVDGDSDGYVACSGFVERDTTDSIVGGGDCDTADGNTFPGAAEAESTTSCRRDADGDGYGAETVTSPVVAGNDCDDARAYRNPDASEVCDGYDNNCNGAVSSNEQDGDSDGYLLCSSFTDRSTTDSFLGGGDCAPSAANTFPGAAPNDSPSNACRRDADNDNYGDSSPPVGVTAGTDCNDAASSCTTDCTSDTDGDSVVNCRDGCTDADRDNYGVTVNIVCTTDGTTACAVLDAACTGTDCADNASSCTTDCTSDTDGDSVVNCRDGCTDADRDNYGTTVSISCTTNGTTACAVLDAACTGTDCDDAASSCTSNCTTDTDGDSVINCRDGCTDADRDNYGTTVSITCTTNGTTACSVLDAACTGTDCADNASSCTSDCTSDTDGDSVIDCRDGCTDVDRDNYGTTVAITCTTNGTTACSVLDAACTGTDCSDAASTCTTTCAGDTDGDGIPNCRDACVDADDDGRGTANASASTCTTNGTLACAGARACLGADCDDTAKPGCWSGATCAADADADGYCAGDGDCDDTAGSGAGVNMGATEACGDSADNDCDGLSDCADPDCSDSATCTATGEAAADNECTNGTDDEATGDELIDCADAGCWADAACTGGEGEGLYSCLDGYDNDKDGQTDCEDTACWFYCSGGESCSTAGDEEGDGLANCADPECRGRAPCLEICDDGLDNDGDGAVDCRDSACSGTTTCSGATPESACADGADNDSDGFTDCADADCSDTATCGNTETTTCANGLDDDGDGFVDCEDAGCGC